jgi:hypothetical protein
VGLGYFKITTEKACCVGGLNPILKTSNIMVHLNVAVTVSNIFMLCITVGGNKMLSV